MVLFPLIMLMMGIVEFGRVYSMQLQLQHAAREAAREIALHYDDPGLLDPLALDALVDDTLDDLLGTLTNGLDTTIVSCSTTAPVEDAQVILSRDVGLAIPLPAGSTLDTIELNAGARMPCEG